ncbi:MAG: ligase-associated DNA damage response exonuclease [Chitinophagaceae bacterium]|nr:MAG: ligase-associated DNA damage response exonuclease [Chitinophagaceae bacterium]
MLISTPQGLYCRAGNFYIDPNRGVENAVVTHAHSDHARRGANRYFCAESGLGLLRARLGQKINAEGIPFGQQFQIGGVKLSFHPAGHILGSAQVRMEYAGEVWVASGDYKRDADPTCEPFENVACDVFVTEATFGTPAYRWNKGADLGREIHQWWEENAAEGRNSVLFAYSLGKAQRVLGVLAPLARRPVHCDPNSAELTACYRGQGISLAPTVCLSKISPATKLRGELLLVPRSFLQSRLAPAIGADYRTAFASGWMARGSHNLDKGFVMSDHADWDDLVRTVKESGARRVYVQHRGAGALVRHLKGMGLEAFPEEALVPKNPNQLAFF